MESMVAATLMPSVMASLGGFKLYPWIADSYLFSSLILRLFLANWSI